MKSKPYLGWLKYVKKWSSWRITQCYLKESNENLGKVHCFTEPKHRFLSGNQLFSKTTIPHEKKEFFKFAQRCLINPSKLGRVQSNPYRYSWLISRQTPGKSVLGKQSRLSHKQQWSSLLLDSIIKDARIYRSIQKRHQFRHLKKLNIISRSLPLIYLDTKRIVIRISNK